MGGGVTLLPAHLVVTTASYAQGAAAAGIADDFAACLPLPRSEEREHRRKLLHMLDNANADKTLLDKIASLLGKMAPGSSSVHLADSCRASPFAFWWEFTCCWQLP